MRDQPLAAEPVTAVDMRLAPLHMQEGFVMHRFPGHPHEDGPDCWCAPIIWTYEQCQDWPLKDIQDRLDRFFCVH